MTFLALRAFLSRIPVQAWLALAAALLLWLAYSWAYGRGEAAVQARWDVEKAAIAAEAAKAAAEAKAREDADKAAITAAAARLKQENANALAERDSLIRDLRAGRVRVRETLRCPSRMPEAAGRTPGSDEAGGAYVSRENQEFFLRLGTEADNAARQLTACQAILAAERK